MKIAIANATCLYCPKEAWYEGGTLCRTHWDEKQAELRRAKVRICQNPIDPQHTFSGRDPRAIYCSDRCSDIARRERRVKPSVAIDRGIRLCEYCKGPIPEDKQINAKYCCPGHKVAAYRLRKSLGLSIEDFVKARICIQCTAPIGPLQPLDSEFCGYDCAYRNSTGKVGPKKKVERFCLRDGKLLLGAQTKFCDSECRRFATWARRFGLTCAELDELLEKYPVCEICGTDSWGKKGPCIDHDHATGAVRSVLCGKHNRMLGLGDDDPKILRAGAAYLERWALIQSADKLSAHPNWPANIDPQLIASLRVLT